MADKSDPMETMKANLLKNTGKSVDQWADLVRGSGLAKHGDQMTLLKETHGLGHGYANLICHTAKGSLDVQEEDLLTGQFVGKEGLRPIYDALETFAKSLGEDVEISPKKTSVAFRRSKNFAVMNPATKTRNDLGLNLKGTDPTARLLAEKPGSMCTHKVKLEAVSELDSELKSWITAAFELAR
jgi:predicted transport protein